jgi:hypothetical protein
VFVINLLISTYFKYKNQEASKSTGTTYFNITGSVSASSYYGSNYYGNGSNLTGLYNSPVLFNSQTSSYTASVSDIGKMIELSGSTTINIILPTVNQDGDFNPLYNFPIGSQITFIQTGDQTTTFITGSDIDPPYTKAIIYSSGDARTLNGKYSVATCVKKSEYEWYLFGDLG